MFLCPLTSAKLRSAYARGAYIWYSPDNGGRLITFAAAKKIMGEDSARELWLRSEVKSLGTSWKKCPSCSRGMRIVQAPQWAGAYEVDVCRSCHLIWLDKTDFPAVPIPEDLLTHYGDASLVGAVAKNQSEILIAYDKKENPSIIGDGPDDLWKCLPAVMGMPVEMDDSRKDGFGWMTWSLALLMFVIHLVFTSKNPEFIRDWGLIPNQSDNHFGLTIISWGFVHGDWFHLISNLYFFGVFADDVEVYYGKKKFLIIILGCLLFSAFIYVMLGYQGDIPHVGISGVICCLMVNYGLIYRKSRIAFLLPYTHTVQGVGFLRAFGWFRIASYWVIAGYVAKDLLYFAFFESAGISNVSHSGHLLGAIFGFIIWFLNGSPNWYFDTVPSQENKLKSRSFLPYE